MQDYKEGRVRGDTFILSGDSSSIITTLLDPRAPRSSAPNNQEGKKEAKGNGPVMRCELVFLAASFPCHSLVRFPQRKQLRLIPPRYSTWFHPTTLRNERAHSTLCALGQRIRKTVELRGLVFHHFSSLSLSLFFCPYFFFLSSFRTLLGFSRALFRGTKYEFSLGFFFRSLKVWKQFCDIINILKIPW